MCEQCVTNPLYFGRPIPGFTLIKARRQGNDMPLGAWGLVECNDPTFTFEFDFHCTPDTDKWFNQEYELWGMLGCHPVTGHRLIEACKQIGYDTEDNFVEWFIHRIHSWIAVVDPETDEDPFPNIDAERPHDYSEWVKPGNPQNISEQLELFK